MLPPAPPSQITDALLQGLAPIIEGLCRSRYGAPIHLHIQESESPDATTQIELIRAPLLHVDAVLTVHHVGGNVYDVQITVYDDAATTRSFTHCVSEATPPPVPSHLIREIAFFLLDTTERLLGRRLLREHVDAPSLTTQRPSDPHVPPPRGTA